MPVNNPVAALLATHRVLVLDGALATQLEARGCDLSDPLWSAKVLIERPELIYQVHLDYFNAGAQCAITASYQATPPGFLQRGLDQRQSLALIAFHRPRIAALAEAGVDLLACETLPSFSELQALLALLQQFPTLGAWFAFTLRDSQHLSDGTPLVQVLAALRDNPQVLAIGINCIALERVAAALRQLAEMADKPLLVYPNSGEHYDAVSKTWHPCGTVGGSLIDQVGEWQKLGARLIGGCCRTTPQDIRQIAARFKE